MPVTVRVFAAFLLLVIPCGCRDCSVTGAAPATKPAYSKGVLGVWVVRTESTMRGVTEVPHELGDRFADLDTYRAWLGKRVEGLQFEFYPDNKVFLRYADGGGVRKFNWARREDGSYWLNEPGFLGLSASIGHRFDTTSDHSAVCRYQVEWNENSAPRSPLVLEKVWE